VSTQIPQEDEKRDLGFGSVVTRESRRRLLNRDGSFNVERTGLSFWSTLSPYHSLLTMSWWKFHMLVASFYLTANTIFALATGLLFARFSKPTARILFSDKAIIAPYHEIKAFEFRIANARKSQIIELEAKVLFSRLEGLEGQQVRRFYPLTLERDKVAFSPLSWTLVHPINETSPLSGSTYQDLYDSDAEFLVLLTGVDENFSELVHARSSYKPGELVWGAKFLPIFTTISPHQPISIDIRKLSYIETMREV
jgi:hypothetical protein